MPKVTGQLDKAGWEALKTALPNVGPLANLLKGELDNLAQAVDLQLDPSGESTDTQDFVDGLKAQWDENFALLPTDVAALFDEWGQSHDRRRLKKVWSRQ